MSACKTMILLLMVQLGAMRVDAAPSFGSGFSGLAQRERLGDIHHQIGFRWIDRSNVGLTASAGVAPAVRVPGGLYGDARNVFPTTEMMQPESSAAQSSSDSSSPTSSTTEEESGEATTTSATARSEMLQVDEGMTMATVKEPKVSEVDAGATAERVISESTTKVVATSSTTVRTSSMESSATSRNTRTSSMSVTTSTTHSSYQYDEEDEGTEEDEETDIERVFSGTGVRGKRSAESSKEPVSFVGVKYIPIQEVDEWMKTTNWTEIRVDDCNNVKGCRVIGVPGPGYNSTNAMENLVQEIMHEEVPSLVPEPNNTVSRDVDVETETHERERRSVKEDGGHKNSTTAPAPLCDGQVRLPCSSHNLHPSLRKCCTQDFGNATTTAANGTEEGYFDRLPETTTPTPPIHGVPRVINSLIKAAMVLSTIVAIGMLI